MNGNRQAIIVMILSTVPVLASGETPECHEEMARLDGVAAYSNEVIPSPVSCGGRGTYGNQYQCVEFIDRYYAEALGVSGTEGWIANGGDYFGKASEFGLEAYKNGDAGTPPRKGDILDFGRPGTEIGHAAIVSGFDRDSMLVHIIEQNWSFDGVARLSIEQKADGKWYMPPRGNSTPYEILGWLRLPGSTPPPADCTPALRRAKQCVAAVEERLALPEFGVRSSEEA